jgi:hypothetical protein
MEYQEGMQIYGDIRAIREEIEPLIALKDALIREGVLKEACFPCIIKQRAMI